MLGYLYHFGTTDVQAASIGFLGIAVALLGRNTALGVGLAAFLFGGLLYGTTHGLQSGTIDPSLAGHLTEMIQGLVVLFVGADVLILAVWNSRRKLKRKRPTAGPGSRAGGGLLVSTYVGTVQRAGSRLVEPTSVGSIGVTLGVIAFVLAIPPIAARSPLWPILLGIVAMLFGIAAASRGAYRVGFGRDRRPASSARLSPCSRRGRAPRT